MKLKKYGWLVILIWLMVIVLDAIFYFDGRTIVIALAVLTIAINQIEDDNK